MGAATASGNNRAKEAITAALDSPLLNDNQIRGAKNVLLLIVSGNDEITIDEIGEVNDFIQTEAGGAANIIMGIGEDEKLGDEISITIIATGFNADQQKQVIGKAPAKIVHPLEDDQAISTSLYDKPITLDEEEEDSLLEAELDKALSEIEEQPEVQASLFEEPQNNTTVHKLEEELEESLPEVELESPSFVLENEAEEVHSEIEPEFEEEPIVPVQELESAEEESTEEETIHFELTEDEDPFDSFSLSDQINSARVEEEQPAVEEAPSINDDLSESGEEDEAMNFDFFTIDAKEDETEETIINEAPQELEAELETPAETFETATERKVYSLSDYEALEAQLNQHEEAASETSMQAPQAEPEIIAEEDEDEALHFEIKTKEDNVEAGPSDTLIDPMNSSIEESMKVRAEERRAKLKAFNYRFKNNPHSLNDADAEPAYKRHGIDIEQGSISNRETQSRMTIDNSEGGNDLKSNNSFLHDNVDW